MLLPLMSKEGKRDLKCVLLSVGVGDMKKRRGLLFLVTGGKRLRVLELAEKITNKYH
jgi:hypothetical protein